MGEPHSLPYFQGNMTQTEAKIMLQQEQNGAFLLRKNPRDEYVLSLKYDNRMCCFKVADNLKEGGTYSITNPANGKEKISASSLRTLVEELKSRTVLSKPVISEAPSIQTETKFMFNVNTVRMAGSKWMESVGLKKEREERELLLEDNSSAGDTGDSSEIEKEEQELLSGITRKGMNEAKGIVCNRVKGSWLLFKDKNDEIVIAFKGKQSTKLRRIFKKTEGKGYSLEKASRIWTSLMKVISGLEDKGTLKEQVNDYDSETDPGSTSESETEQI